MRQNISIELFSTAVAISKFGNNITPFSPSSSTELPGPPTNLAISNIGPRSVTLQYKPGYDGKTSISRWQVEAQVRLLMFLPT